MNFKVGDVCVIVLANQFPQMVGMECTVTSLLSEHEDGGEPGHTIDVPSFPRMDGSIEWFAVPYELRLKRPPSWDEWLFDTSHVKDEQRDLLPA